MNAEPSSQPLAPLSSEEVLSLELRWYEGRMLRYVEWITAFVARHREEILARAGPSPGPEALLAATKELIVELGSVHMAGELLDQSHEIEVELWLRGEKGDHDRLSVQENWTALHAAAWRKWRIKEYLFVADRCAQEIATRLLKPA